MRTTSVCEDPSQSTPLRSVELRDGRSVALHRLVRSEPAELVVAACDPVDGVVGVAITDFRRAGATAEASVQVVPAWQRIGLGRALVEELVEQSTSFGVEHLVATFPAHDLAAARMIGRVEGVVARRVAGGMVKVSIAVPVKARLAG